jgi:steroid delta-isomerase-like uncharacterized protein
MTTPEQNKELAREFAERAFNQHDLEYVKTMLSDDFVEHEDAPGITGHDKAAALQWFETMFKAVPDMWCKVNHVLASDDKVAIHVSFGGIDEGGLMPGVPATGKSFEIEGIDIVRVNDDGKFSEHWGISDGMGMMMQLGLVQPPPNS